MTSDVVALLVVFFGLLLLCVKPLGLYMADVMEGRAVWPVRVGGGFERLVYRVCGIDASVEMGWKR